MLLIKHTKKLAIISVIFISSCRMEEVPSDKNKTMSYGVIGNTSVFGTEESRFEPLWDN